MTKTGSKIYWFRRLYLRSLPILVWLGTVACVVVLFQRRAERFEILGFAQGQVHQVQATSPGRLKSVSVQLFDNVSLGDTVAIIDTVLDNEPLLQEQLKAQLATARAGIEHLMTQLIPTQETMLAEAANLETDNVATQRRYDVDVENARVRILETKALIASDRVMLDDLAVEVKIVRELLAEEAVAPYELDKAQVAYETLKKKIEENERLLEQCEQDLKQAQERRDEFALRQTQHPSVDSALEVIHKAITVQERLMDELWVQLEALELRHTVELKAPFDGVVVPIQGMTREFALRRPGESILRRPGEVAEARPREIIAYASQEQIGQFRKEVEVTLIKKAYPPAKGQIAFSRVVHVGPTVERKPERLWLNPAIPEWGLPILIEIPRGWELVSGELVGIRLGRL